MATESLVKSFDQLGKEYIGKDFAGGDAIVADLAKALAQTNLSGFGDATPLKLENLDSTMTSVLFQESHLKLFQSIPRVPSAQVLYQWNRRTSYGSSRGAVGFPEGGAPKGSLSAWVRNTATNKFLGTKGGYTHQAMITGNLGGMQLDPVAEENRNRTLELLEKLEREIVFGDSGRLDQSGNAVHYDGLIKQITAGSAKSVFDMKGEPLDFETFDNIAELLRTNGKLANFDRMKTLFSPRVLTDLSKLKLQAERKDLTTDSGMAGYRPGTPLAGYKTQFGYIPFDDSIFLEPVDGSKPLAADEPGAAAASSSVTGVAASDTVSTLTAGTYYYSVGTVNDSGESAPAISSGIAATAGQKITVTITRVTGATMYRVYRGVKSDGSDALWIANVMQPSSGNASFVDQNQWMPGTGMGLILNMNDADIAIAQMAPLIKFPLAIVNTTIEFLLLLYHVLVVKAAERMILIKNIGKRS